MLKVISFAAQFRLPSTQLLQAAAQLILATPPFGHRATHVQLRTMTRNSVEPHGP